MKLTPFVIKTELDVFTVTRITIEELPDSVSIHGRYLDGEYEVIKSYATLKEAKRAFDYIWDRALSYEGRMVDLTQHNGY